MMDDDDFEPLFVTQSSLAEADGLPGTTFDDVAGLDAPSFLDEFGHLDRELFPA